MMTLSITTDYARDTGNPEPYLRQISEAGFSHVHWCHHWNTDFMYLKSELNQIGEWLNQYHLKLLDIHASDGSEKNWASPREYERLAGVELVKNRIDMAVALGSDVIVMHIPSSLDEPIERDASWLQLRKSLDVLEPVARAQGVRIAIENTTFDSLRGIHKLFALYDPAYLGLCFDCGHSNLIDNGLDQLEMLKERLIAVHLHDNDGNDDQHNIPFTGTVDWQRLARLMAASSYKKCVSMESNMRRSGISDEREFLAKAFVAGTKLKGMIEQASKVEIRD
jgi:sugar phosphate isomerase/epimerase